MRGDDQVFPCGCGFDDVSFPHECTPKKPGKNMTAISNTDLMHNSIGRLHVALDLLQKEDMKVHFNQEGHAAIQIIKQTLRQLTQIEVNEYNTILRGE